jgi:two-component system phosphate regulon sensor histidine kinase PhoR
MKFRSLISLNALLVSLAFAFLVYYFQRDWLAFFIGFAISFCLSFFLFYYLMERYVYSKIKIIYKLIHHLKLGKDLKDALGTHVSDDPINDVQAEVRQWAFDKKLEIDALKDQEKFRREFLNNVSHEFKTPIFAINGYLEALQDGIMEEDPKLAKNFLDKAVKNLDRLSYLIKDLDEISKLERGDIEMNLQRFDLSLLILEVIDLLDIKAKKNKIDLVFKDKYNRHFMVYADREKIRQVFINLIINSFKYGRENGRTNIKLFEMHNQILVEITDNGIGIDEKYIPRLFERFFRTDKSRSRRIGGSGLGLAIVKHILESHQQTITVRSTLDIGSTFAFTLEKR